MDVLVDELEALDGPLLASLWTRAVLAGDADWVARCEQEANQRGTTCRALIAATKKKDDDTITVTGKETKGPRDYAGIIAQEQKNIREGKDPGTGQHGYKTKGGSTNPYRRGKGKGGGQFTSKEHSGESTAVETTDPEKARKGYELQEDDPRIPDHSPGGAEIDDFRDGMMIYKDGMRFDGKGWRNKKGEATDENGKVLRKPKKGAAKKAAAKKTAAKSHGGGAGGKTAQQKAAEKAASDAAQKRSKDWDAQEARRQAEEDAAQGNYTKLLGIAEHNEREARKRRDLATDPAERAQADKDVAAAQADLKNIRADAEKAKAANEAKRQAEADKKAADRKAEADRKAAAEKAARYNAIAANYPAWEAEVRQRYAGSDLSEEELKDLILRDRMRRVRLLPADYGKPGADTGNLETMPRVTDTGGTPSGGLKTVAPKMQEDDSPQQSPRGGKLTSFENGVARYSDGWWFDGTSWHDPTGKTTDDKPGARFSD